MHAEVDNEMCGRIRLRAMRACGLRELRYYAKGAHARLHMAVKSKRQLTLPVFFHVLCLRLSVKHALYIILYIYIMPRRRQKQSNRYITHDTGQSNRQCRIKKRGKGHRLPSQAKYIVESVRKFFNNEKT